MDELNETQKILAGAGYPDSALQRYLELPEDQRASVEDAERFLYENWPEFRFLPDDREEGCPYHCEQGHLFTTDADGVLRARPCPHCQFGFRPAHPPHSNPAADSPRRSFLLLNDQLTRENWEGWPVEDFEVFKYSPEYESTQSNLAGWRLRNKIEGGGNGFLAMTGQSGRGKTYTALQVLSFAAKQGLTCGAYHFKDLVDLSKKGLDAKDQVARRWNMIKTFDVLLLDELGDETGGRMDHAAEWINGIFREYLNKNTLIVTSNLTKDKFLTYLPDKLLSRISGGWGEIIDEPEGQKDLRGKILF